MLRIQQKRNLQAVTHFFAPRRNSPYTISMSNMAIDQTQIVNKYPGQWVILDDSGTKALAAHPTLKGAIKRFRDKYGQRTIPSTFKVPTEIMPYIGVT